MLFVHRLYAHWALESTESWRVSVVSSFNMLLHSCARSVISSKIGIQSVECRYTKCADIFPQCYRWIVFLHHFGIFLFFCSNFDFFFKYLFIEKNDLSELCVKIFFGLYSKPNLSIVDDSFKKIYHYFFSNSKAEP